MLASRVFLGAMRFDAAAARIGRDHGATRTSLGKLVIEASDSTKPREVKAR